MDVTTLNEFTFLCWLTGIPCILVSIIYKVQPPKKRQWYHGIQLKAAWRSEATWKATHQFAALPIGITGIALTIAGALPFLFPEAPLFTFRSAFILFLIFCLVLKVLIEKHINNRFDTSGNSKRSL